jgi:hypothetical protein
MKKLEVVAFALAATFALLCVLHVGWAFGGKFAAANALPTVRDRPVIQPSRAATLAVAAALALAAVVVLVRAGLLFPAFPPRLATLACFVLGSVFVLRAIGEFRLVGFFKSVRGTPFAHWDTWLYSPLSLLIGIGALWLASAARPR